MSVTATPVYPQLLVSGIYIEPLPQTQAGYAPVASGGQTGAVGSATQMFAL